MARKRKVGRKEGSRNRGYFFRKNRGWYIRVPGEPKLCDLQGNHLKSPAQNEEAAASYARYLAQTGRSPTSKAKEDSISVGIACQHYVEHVRRHGSPETYRLRHGYLFDFCTGYKASFKDCPEEAQAKDRTHAGYGKMAVADLTPHHVQAWLDAHPRWKATKPPVQAVLRALSWCLEMKLIKTNPVPRLKVVASGQRIAYFSDEVEAALLKHASPALATAIRVQIRTGARPLIEFGSVEKRHVQVDASGVMSWYFPAKEAKGGEKERTVYVPPEIKPLVEEALRQHPTGPLFRDDDGNPWTAGDSKRMKNDFKNLRNRLLRRKVPIDPTDVMYVCRHTFAKRMLGGYWGVAVSLEVLAGLMGNTPEVCYKHYARWSKKFNEPLVKASGYE